MMFYGFLVVLIVAIWSLMRWNGVPALKRRLPENIPEEEYQSTRLGPYNYCYTSTTLRRIVIFFCYCSAVLLIYSILIAIIFATQSQPLKGTGINRNSFAALSALLIMIGILFIPYFRATVRMACNYFQRQFFFPILPTAEEQRIIYQLRSGLAKFQADKNFIPTPPGESEETLPPHNSQPLTEMPAGSRDRQKFQMLRQVHNKLELKLNESHKLLNKMQFGAEWEIIETLYFSICHSTKIRSDIDYSKDNIPNIADKTAVCLYYCLRLMTRYILRSYYEGEKRRQLFEEFGFRLPQST